MYIRKVASLNEISPKVWNPKSKFDDIFLRLSNAVYKQNTEQKWTKAASFPSPQIGEHIINKNYRGITLLAKVYMPWFSIISELKRKFRFWLSVKSPKEYVQKNIEATLLFVDFSKAFDSMHRRKMKQILQAYGLPQRNYSYCNDALPKRERNDSFTR